MVETALARYGTDMMRPTLRLTFSLAIGLFAAAAESVCAEDVPSSVRDAGVGSGRVSFANEVRPLLARRCFSCHGPDEAAGNLDLTSAAGGQETDSGTVAIVAGDADASELMARVLSHEEGYRMPEEGDRLTDREIDLLRRWIDQGGHYDKHWSFEPRGPVQIPRVASDWPRSPIDSFVWRRLDELNLPPPPEADRRTLIRRVTQDLIGLPPSPEAVDAFAVDPDPLAYERLVDRLLASPHFGERWGRHWLDVVRFAETNSFERDGEKRNAFTYRDYVIDSLNADRPYDQFVIDQLAGDERENPTRGQLAATGLLRLGLWDDEPADPELHRFDQYDDLVRTVSEGFLGLTVGCARCHDHKIDPIPQSDYYSMVAFFRGVPEFGVRFDPDRYNQIETTAPNIRGEHRQIDRDRERVAASMKTIEDEGIRKMAAPEQRAAETRRRPKVLRTLREYLSPERWRQYQGLRAESQALDLRQASLPPREYVFGVTGTDPSPPPTYLLERGNPQSPAAETPPEYLSILGGGEPVAADGGAASSRRRTALAKWIATDPQGTTSRVMANRVWQHHFGRGLFRSANNLGQLGTPPTHPELLDWLAGELVRGNWSLKALHRQIVTSATYRMSTKDNAAALAVDPQNDLFWRFDIRRMDAEEIRDAILSVSGQLNASRVGGPSVFPPIEAGVLAGQSRPGEGWTVSPPPEQTRRSVYVFAKRSLPLPLFTVFDFPETDSTCEGRFQTVQAAQALSLLNSRFLADQSSAFRRRLVDEVGNDLDLRMRRAIELTYCRDAADDEVDRFVALARQLTSEHGIDASRAEELALLTLLNTSEFLFVN